MEKKIDRILSEISEVKGDMSEMKVVQTENTMVLKEHTRRSLANEKRIGQVERFAERTWLALQTHFGKLDGFINTIKWLCILVTGLGAGFGVIYGGINLYLKLRGVK